MDGSIAAIVMTGFGNGTVVVDPSLVVTMGYGITGAVAPSIVPSVRIEMDGRSSTVLMVARSSRVEFPALESII